MEHLEKNDTLDKNQYSITPKCLKVIRYITSKMFYDIFVEIDKYPLIPKSIFVSFMESCKGFALCYEAFKIQAYSQIGTLLRQLIEQVAEQSVLVYYPEVWDEYKRFKQLVYREVTGSEEDKQKLKKEITAEIKSKTNMKKLTDAEAKNYLEWGWLLKISEGYQMEDLLSLSKMNDLKDWRKFFNNYVHSKISFSQYGMDGMVKSLEEISYILCVLFDVFMCSFYKLTNYTFVYGKNDARKKFISLYAKMTKARCELMNTGK